MLGPATMARVIWSAWATATSCYRRLRRVGRSVVSLHRLVGGAVLAAVCASNPARAASPIDSPAFQESELLHRRLALDGLVEWNAKSRSWREFVPASRVAKVTVLHLWSPRCAPCVEELPLLQRMIDAWRSDSSVRFLVVADHTEAGDGSELLSFVERHGELGALLPLLRLRDGRLRDSLGLSVQPLTLLIDEQRVVRQVFIGPLAGRNVGSAIARLRDSLR